MPERLPSSSAVSIRPGRLADVPAVCDIVQRAYEVYIARIGRRPTPMDDDYRAKVRAGHVFVADRCGVVGLIVLLREPDHVLIENVAVHPCRQGSGVGRTLLGYAETVARRDRVDMLRLYTNAAMTENLALYRRLGYSEDQRRGEGGMERVYMSKRLT